MPDLRRTLDGGKVSQANLIAFDGSGQVNVEFDRLIAGRMLIQANSGGGKSRALRYLIEQTAGKVQIIVIDPEGEFPSLREKLDMLLAGKGGDVDAHPKTAKVLCRRLMELGASAVIDLYDLPLDQRRSFVRLFLDELMHLPRALWRPLLVVIDEAHVFCPESGSGKSESKDAVISLCTQGRKRGFAAVLATQRIAKLDKDAAAELLNKLIGRTGLDVDVKRAGDELGFGADRRQELKHLQPGEFYAFGPAISRDIVLVRTGAVSTTHPEPGTVAPPPPPAPAKIQQMLMEMQGLQNKAEEEARDFESAMAQVKSLEAELRKARSAAPVDPEELREAEARLAESIQRQDALETECAAATINLATAAQTLARVVTELQSLQEICATYVPADREFMPVLRASQPSPRRDPVQPALADEDAPPFIRDHKRTPEPRKQGDHTGSVSRPEQAILDALASFAAIGLSQMTKSNLAVFSGNSPKSSSFANKLGSLRTAGMIDYPSQGMVGLTHAGHQIARTTDAPATLDGLQEAWLSKLSGPQSRIVRLLIDCYPGPLPREFVAEQIDASPKSSSFANNLGHLRGLGLIDYPSSGQVVATALLFPEGLR